MVFCGRSARFEYLRPARQWQRRFLVRPDASGPRSGEVTARLMAPVLKTGERQPSECSTTMQDCIDGPALADPQGEWP